MSETETERETRVISLWSTIDHKDIILEYGYVSPEKRGFLASGHRVESEPPFIFCMSPNVDFDFKPVISVHEVNDFRGFRQLYEKHELPDFQHLDLTKSYEGYKVREILLGDCYDQRKTYPYLYKMGGQQGQSLHLRKITQRERLPYRLENLKTKNNRKLYVTLRCSVCGTQKRITVTPRNEGRATPVCTHSNTHRADAKPQEFYVKSVKRQKAVKA